MDFLKLANLRPGQPMATLAEAIGGSWKAPEYEDLGCVRLGKKDQKKFFLIKIHFQHKKHIQKLLDF